jgi:hypothetical protein
LMRLGFKDRTGNSGHDGAVRALISALFPTAMPKFVRFRAISG